MDDEHEAIKLVHWALAATCWRTAICRATNVHRQTYVCVLWLLSYTEQKAWPLINYRLVNVLFRPVSFSLFANNLGTNDRCREHVIPLISLSAFRFDLSSFHSYFHEIRMKCGIINDTWQLSTYFLGQCQS